MQAGLRNCIWADSFAIGVVARWTKQCDDGDGDGDGDGDNVDDAGSSTSPA